MPEEFEPAAGMEGDQDDDTAVEQSPPEADMPAQEVMPETRVPETEEMMAPETAEPQQAEPVMPEPEMATGPEETTEAPTSGLLTCGDTVCEKGDNFCTRFGFCARLAKEGEECLAATRVLGFCEEGLTCVDLTGNAQVSVFGFVVDEGATECQPTVVVADGEPCGDPALPNVCAETSICSGNEGDLDSGLLVNRVCVAEPKEGEQCVASVRGFGGWSGVGVCRSQRGAGAKRFEHGCRWTRCQCDAMSGCIGGHGPGCCSSFFSV